MLKYLITSILFVTGIILINQSYIHTSDQSVMLISPPKYLSNFTFGFDESLSDSLWIRWIQSSESCGKSRLKREEYKKKKVVLYGGEDINTGASKAFNRRNDKEIFEGVISFAGAKNICQKGWSFQILESIVKLTPKFRMPYFAGATTLSVLTEDPEGAKIIYDSGLKQFPDDWNLHYRAAYHYLYELKDFEKAAYLMDRAGDLGAPKWVKSLAARLYTSTGQAYLGLVTLKSYLNEVDLPERRIEVENRIRQLQQLIAKEKAKELQTTPPNKSAQ